VRLVAGSSRVLASGSHCRLVVTVPEKTDARPVIEALESTDEASESGTGVAGNREVKSDKLLSKGTVGVDQAPVVAWLDLTGYPGPRARYA
jgi:hypothetical protein